MYRSLQSMGRYYGISASSLPTTTCCTYVPWTVGKNTLPEKLRKCASYSGIKTNHSLRATGATSLYEKGVPDRSALVLATRISVASYPGIHFGVMNGCTFNINSPAVHGSSSSTYKDDEIDVLFRHYQEF